MQVVINEKYENLAAEFQYRQVSLLKAALEKYGVSSASAKEICGEFTFDLAVFLDQGEIDLGNESYRPCLTFTNDEETFLAQPSNVEFHEYAFGTTAEVFESSEI